MSTVPEVVRALNHRMKVLGISVISKHGSGHLGPEALPLGSYGDDVPYSKDFEDLITNVVLARDSLYLIQNT